MRRRAPEEGGFTLIEILVALTILALAAAAGFKIFSDGAVRIGDARREETAAMLAESILARVGTDVAVQPSHYSGEAAAQRWSLDIGANLADPPPAAGLAAFPVRVGVLWQEGPQQRAFQLDSVRLGPAPEAP